MKKYFSLIVAVALLVFFGFYLNKNLAIIFHTFSTTTANLTRYVLVALLLVALSYYFIAKSYQVVFRMNGLTRTVWDNLRLNLAGKAVNVIIPTAGVSQAITYVEDAGRRGEARSTALNAVLITYISDYSSIALFLLFSLVYLALTHSVMPYVVVPAIIFILITIGVYVLSYLAGRESVWLENIILFLADQFEKLVRFVTRKKISVGMSVDNLYKNFKDVNKSILDDPKDWFLAIFYACLQHLFAIFALYVIFVSLGVHPIVRVLIAAYSVGAVFVVVSPTPNGIGFVEGAMYLVFTSLGISGPVATTATIIYRGLIFWLPLGIGFFIYQQQKIKDIFVISS